jgi:hypothetical protein
MWSVPRRFNESSAAVRMLAADWTVSPGFLPTLVAMTIRLRLPRNFIQRPMTASDSPPEWPGTHEE